MQRREAIKEQVLSTDPSDIQRLQGYAAALADIVNVELEDVE